MEEQTEQLKKHYILHYILKPGLDAAGLDNYRTGLNKRVSALGGQIEASICEEQMRNLAYPIKKTERGHFCEFAFLMEPEKIKDLCETIKHEPEVIRYIVESRRKARRIPRTRRVLRDRGLAENATAGTREGSLPQAEKRDKISIEEIDKKLDEIIKNI